MKSTILAVAVASSMMMSSAFAAVEGETSSVHFTGSITEASCALNANNSVNFGVQLGDVASNTFSGTGSTSSAQDFSINLTGCAESVQNASITFSGDTVNDTALKTSAIDTTNVGIQILQNNTPLKVDGSESSATIPLNPGANTLTFAARYVSVADTVAAGEANGSASFTLHYE